MCPAGSLSISTVCVFPEHIQVPLPKIALLIELTWDDDLGVSLFVDRSDTTQPNAVGPEALHRPTVRAVELVVMVAMNDNLRAHGLSQRVEQCKAVRVISRRLVCDEHISVQISPIAAGSAKPALIVLVAPAVW
jgi:hypothetical protein